MAVAEERPVSYQLGVVMAVPDFPATSLSLHSDQQSINNMKNASTMYFFSVTRQMKNPEL